MGVFDLVKKKKDGFKIKVTEKTYANLYLSPGTFRLVKKFQSETGFDFSTCAKLALSQEREIVTLRKLLKLK